jgi:hypothetical protein
MEMTGAVDRHRQVLLLRVAGFASLALGFLGSIACFVAAALAIVDAVGQFHTVAVPSSPVLTLEHRHYVIYYEEPLAAPGQVDARGLSVSVRPAAGASDPVPVSDYGLSFTYTRGDYSGRAVLAFDAPHAGPYVITTADPDAGAEARIVVGPSVLGLLTHDLLPGVLGAIVVFFGVGGVGALLLTLSDRRAADRSHAATP